MMALYNIKLSDAKLHISKGNNKIGKGIWSFSTLPGNSEHLLYIGSKVLLTDIPGTCSKYCEGCARDGACYAWRDAKLHHNAVIRAWGENTLLLRSGKVWALLKEFFDSKNKKAMALIKEWRETPSPVPYTWDEIVAQAKDLAAVKTFRINVSGEIENVSELKGWATLAFEHPEIQFGVYTKNFDALGKYLDACLDNEECLPENLVINVSEWHGVASEFINKYQAKYPGAFNVFEYDDHNKKDCSLSPEDVERLEKTAHCPAVMRNGYHAKTAAGVAITCDMCGRCYRKTGQRTAVWSH